MAQLDQKPCTIRHVHTWLPHQFHPTNRKGSQSVTIVTDLGCQRRQIDVSQEYQHTYRSVTVARGLFRVSDAGMNHIKTATWQKTQNERLTSITYENTWYHTDRHKEKHTRNYRLASKLLKWHLKRSLNIRKNVIIVDTWTLKAISSNKYQPGQKKGEREQANYDKTIRYVCHLTLKDILQISPPGGPSS